MPHGCCRLDLHAVPKKASVMALAEACLDANERVAMLWLCAKDSVGKSLWSSFVEQQGLGIGELLLLFPSCTPTLTTLVAHSPRMAPRLYSIASSPLKESRALAVAFSVVKYTCKVFAGDTEISSIKRQGLCTAYLQSLLCPLLDGSTTAGKRPIVRIFPKPSLEFHMPGNVSFPLVGASPLTRYFHFD